MILPLAAYSVPQLYPTNGESLDMPLLFTIDEVCALEADGTKNSTVSENCQMMTQTSLLLDLL